MENRVGPGVGIGESTMEDWRAVEEGSTEMRTSFMLDEGRWGTEVWKRAMMCDVWAVVLKCSGLLPVDIRMGLVYG